MSLPLLWSSAINTNLKLVLKEQYIPVYLFAGVHDYQTSYQVAKDYFDCLQAPVKKFYSFPNAAHWLFLEDYPGFEKIVKEEILGNRHPPSQ